MAVDVGSDGTPTNRTGRIDASEMRRLGILLARARLRLADAAPQSPEWAAAVEAVDELEHRVRIAVLDARADRAD